MKEEVEEGSKRSLEEEAEGKVVMNLTVGTALYKDALYCFVLLLPEVCVFSARLSSKSQ